MTKLGAGFCDLNISGNQSNNNLIDSCEMLVKLGFHTIAINHFLDGSIFDPPENKKKGEHVEPTTLVPPPKNIDNLIERFKGKLRILQRLTVKFSDKLQTYKLNQSENVKKYNLLAVLPSNYAAFQYACSSLDVDLITFDPESRTNFKVERKMYHQATKRGVYFEIMYASAIKDSSLRKNVIHMAHLYHYCGKSKNIIITSLAENPFQIRGPYDIINLGLVFGLSEEQSKGALTTICRSLLISAEGRRHGKAAVLVSQTSVLKEESKKTNGQSEAQFHVAKKPRMDECSPD